MNLDRLRSILTELASGELAVDEALAELRHFPYEDLDFAQLDHHRTLRTGVPEVVLGEGKTPEQVLAIVDRFLNSDGRALVTRVDAATADVVQAKHSTTYFQTARLLAVGEFPTPKSDGYAAVVSAGTSDLPVAEEAAVTLELLGSHVKRLRDVGTAGVHRLLDKRDLLWDARVVIAVAGMEGALASVIGGLVGCPVVAVPTSIGYGANFKGLAALLGMLNSCAPGVAVVNIDNGFGAGLFAHLIMRETK